jgi:hypothetical protein
MLLFLDICVFELRHISPAWHGQRSVQDNPCSKHTQPLEQTALKGQNDYKMSGLLSNAIFIDKAVYQSGCITKYLLTRTPDTS